MTVNTSYRVHNVICQLPVLFISFSCPISGIQCMCIPLPFCSLPVCPKDDCGEELTAEDGVKVLTTSIIIATALVLTLVVSLD